MNDVLINDANRIDRVSALAPYVAQIYSLLTQYQGNDTRFKISIKQYGIEVHAWDRAQLRETGSPEPPEPGTWAYQICQGLAVQARALADVTRLEAAQATPDVEQAPLRRELVLDGALAKVVLHELDETIADLNGSGRTGQAKYLAEFAARVAAGLMPLDEALGPDSASAHALASELIALLGKRPEARDVTGPKKSAAAAASTSDAGTGRARGERAYGVKHLLLASAAAIAMIVVPFLGYTELNREPLTVERCLKYVKGIESFNGNPPSLRLIVSTDYWNRLTSSDRTALMHSAVVGLPKLDYSRADFVLKDGRKVGTWEQAKGLQHE